MRLDRRVLPALTFVTVFMASISLSTIALAKEADTEMPIGVPGGAVHADPFTGVATMSIPIEVPPGRHGVQPNLALTYSSSNGNGWVGMGWKLELGAIERQTRFGVDYSKDDYVIRLDAMSADLAPAPPPALSDEYRAKVEGGFLRVKHLANGGWELTDKNGTKYLFGTSSMSRMYDPGDSTRIFMWGLERVEDRDGNYMTVTYQTDGTTNQRYPDHIDYTGSGTLTPSGVVKFHLETRPDRATLMYTSKYPVRTERRLKSVTVWSDQSMSKLVRAYRLGYDLSYGSGASILVGVEQFGSDAIIDGTGAIINASSASKLPIVNFRYRQESQTFAQGVASLSGWCSGGSQFNASDFNGDGKQDLWCRNTSNGFSIAISDGVGTLTAGSNVFSGCSVQRVGDFNGDGKMDLGCVSWYEQPRNCGPIGGLTCEPLINWRASIATATDGLGTFSNPSNWLDPICGALPSYTPALGIGDFNGDGKQDLWCQIRGGTFAQVMVALSTGAAFQTSSNWISNWCIGSTPFGVGDVNGDGKTDVWCHGGGNTSVALSNGTNSFTGGNVWLSNWCGDGLPFGLADFNGDGLTDIWCHSGGNTSVALSNGTNAFVDGGVWRSGWCSNGVPSGGSDFNGDGKDDLWCYTSGGTIQIALSSSVVVPDVPSWLGIWCATGIFGVGDFTGDGKHDLFCQESGQVSIARSGSYPGAVDLLVIVSNGLTGTSTLSYTPSTQYSNTQLPYPFQTVSSITTCDNWVSATETCAGLSATTNYTYAGGYHHPAERDFRGFNYAKVTGPVGPAGEQAITETWFHQGNDVAVGANNPAAPNGYTKGLPYRSKVTDATGKVYSETTTTYVADADGVAPFFTPVAQVDTSIDNGAKQTRVVFPITSGYAPAYDDYGNVMMEYHHGDLATTSDDRSIYRVFGVNTTDWIVGLQTRESVYTGIGTASVNMVAQTDLYYDGTTSCATASVNQVPTKGHVTRTVRWLNGGTSPETRMAYDAFGNLTCTRDALGQTSTVTYDASNTFAKTATNPLGHVATTVYYGVDGVLMDKGLYGQVKSVTDPNNQTTTSEYDALGRKSKTTTPDGLITTATYNYGTGFTVGTQHVLTSTSGAGLATILTTATYFDGLGRTIKKESTGPDGKTVVTEVQYDSRGAVRQKSSPYFKTLESVTGRWAITNYDALGRVVRIDRPDSTRGLACFTDWVTVTIDAADHRKRETKDAYGRTVRVDEYQSTVSTCDTTVGTPYATTTYQYDVQGNLLAVTDAKGNISTMTYDTLGRKTAMHDPDMGNWSYLYDAAGNLTKQTDAKGQVLWFQYDALNRRVQKDFATQKTFGAGDVRYTYDGTTNNRKGRLQQVVDASGTVAFQYDSVGRILQTEKSLDGTTYTTQSTYDGLGRLLTVTYPSIPSKTISYAYNGPVLDKVFEGTTTYIRYTNYNALGQAGTTTYGNGVSTTKTYANTANAVCTQQNFRLCTLKTSGPGSGGGSGSTGTLSGSFTATPSTVNLSTEGTTDWAHWGLVDAASFDHKSGVSSQLNTYSTLGGGTALRYDDNGDGYTWTGGTPTASATNSTTGVYVVGLNKGFQIVVPADTTSRTVKLYLGGWAAQAKLEATLSDSSAAAYTETSFNDAGVNGTNRVYTLTYQAASASQTLTVKWTVTGMNDPQWGNVSAQAVTLVINSGSGGGGGGSSTTYNAQADFSITQGQQGWYYLSSTGAQLTWNGNFWAGTDGYIGLWNDGGYPGNSTDSVRRWVAPAAGSVQITGQAILAETCGGDGTTVTVKKNGTVLWTEALPVHTVVHSFSLSNTVVANDQLDFVTNRTGTSFCDNTIFTPTIVLTTGSGGGSSGTAYQDLRYVYTPDGNVSDIYDNLVAAGAGDQHLSYDSLSRLTLANGPYGTSGTNASLTYTYDELGNLTFNTQVGTYTYPTSGASSVRPHAVTMAGSNTYSYDANGNLSSGAGRTLTYNLENKPLTITSAGQTTTFVYDGDGGRVKKIAGTTTTRYISKLYECDNASCSRMIFAGSARIATIGSGGIVYYHPDHLGSSSVITDSVGAKLQALTYFPYGATRTNTPSGTPTIDVPYKYTGKELDSSTSLYYYEARYYDPTLGRFLSSDTIVPSPLNPQDFNRYTYAGNNPFRYTDPTGHFKIGKFLDRVFDKPWARAIGWAINPMIMQFLDPATRRTTVPVAAGVVGNFVCGPICGGMASGATRAALVQSEGRRANILRSTLAGGVGGLAGGVANLAVPGDMVMAGLAGGMANGAVNAAIGGGSVLQGALMGGATGALTGYYNSQGIIDRTTGPIWSGPNTLIGTGYLLLNTIAAGPVMLMGGEGMGYAYGNGGFQFWNAPLMMGGIRLGAITLMGGVDGNGIPFTPDYNGPSPYEGHQQINLGRHEGGHGIQQEVLGPLFIPLYFLTGGPHEANPFEIGADNYSTGNGSPWSGF